MAIKHNIILYKTQTCSYCHLVEEFLNENKIKFTSIDVGNDTKAAKEMIKKSGQMSVPVIDIDSKIIIGFDRTALKKALDFK